MAPTKIRVYDLSKALNVSNKQVLDTLAAKFDVHLKSHSSTVEDAVAAQLKAMFIQAAKPVVSVKPAVTTPAPAPTTTTVNPPAPSAVVSPPAQRPQQAPAPSTAATQPSRSQSATPTQSQRQPQTPPRQGQAPQQQGGAYVPRGSQPSGGQQQRPANPNPQGQNAGNRNQPNRQQTQRANAARQQNQPAPARQQHQPTPAVAQQVKIAPPPIEVVEAIPAEPIILKNAMTLREFSTLIGQKESLVIKTLFMRGVPVTVNQNLNIDLMLSVATELEIPAEAEKKADLSLVEVADVLGDTTDDVRHKASSTLVSRAPVVSIMGHVDHGKTTLLDAIREARHNIVDSEAGGITQSIGAYTAVKEGKRIVFLDTPGHEAFTSMRMRGAMATDIAILVVAADDGVMPQTIEALNHAKAAKIPIIVAINKIDKASADPLRVQTELMNHGLMTEQMGGDTLAVEVSALQKLGIDDVLETVLLVAELKDMKADPAAQPEGVIIEAQQDKRKGPIATVLVQNGTLRVGDNLLAGSVGGRVRALINDYGQRVDEAGPATPVEVLGLKEVPQAGDRFKVIANEKTFKAQLNVEQTKQRDERLSQRTRMAGGLTLSLADDNKKELRIILKADTQGSLEAVQQALQKLATEEVGVNILHTATGDMTETDAMLASASQAVMLGFNVKPDGNAERIAEQQGLILHTYDIIYHMVEKVEDMMLGQLDAEVHVIRTGMAEVRQLFTVGKNLVAGCMVVDGKIVRNGKIKVERQGKVIHEGGLDTLKRFKDDAKEVAQGYECGISLVKFNDLQVGDTLTCTIEEKRKRTSL